MKHHLITRNKMLPVLIAAGIPSVLLTANADAQRPGAALRRAAAASAIGDPAELAVHRDKFLAFRRTRLVGAGYYAKADFHLQKEHAELYVFIEAATVGGRLTEADARELAARLMATGNKAVSLRGTADSLSEADAKTIDGELRALRAEVGAKATDKAVEATLMPDMNRSQWLMEELLVFGSAEGVLSGAKNSSLRRKLDSLEKAEDEGQKDGSLSDREREKLLRETRETWRSFVDALS